MCPDPMILPDSLAVSSLDLFENTRIPSMQRVSSLLDHRLSLTRSYDNYDQTHIYTSESLDFTKFPDSRLRPGLL